MTLEKADIEIEDEIKKESGNPNWKATDKEPQSIWCEILCP